MRLVLRLPSTDALPRQANSTKRSKETRKHRQWHVRELEEAQID